MCVSVRQRHAPAGLLEAFFATHPLEFVLGLSDVSALQFPFPSAIIGQQYQYYDVTLVPKS